MYNVSIHSSELSGGVTMPIPSPDGRGTLIRLYLLQSHHVVQKKHVTGWRRMLCVKVSTPLADTTGFKE